MAVSYKKLWKVLIDKDMKKKDLIEVADISSYTINKLNRGDNVTTDVLVKICKALDCSFDDIKIEASSRIEQSKFDRIASFNTNMASEYHDQFLCGYICERYSESISQSWNDACDHMDARIKKNVISRYSGVDRVVSYDADTKYMNNTYKYVLVPIYFVNYFFKDKDYQCRINGVNGTINGESPVSVGKVLAIVFSILAVIAAIVILVLLNQ